MTLCSVITSNWKTVFSASESKYSIAFHEKTEFHQNLCAFIHQSMNCLFPCQKQNKKQLSFKNCSDVRNRASTYMFYQKNVSKILVVELLKLL